LGGGAAAIVCGFGGVVEQYLNLSFPSNSHCTFSGILIKFER
jgi:hypothetical protein